MYLVISVLGLACGAFGVLFGLWQARRLGVLRRQLAAMHAAGLEKDKQIERLLTREEKRQRDQAAVTAQARELHNLLSYDGTGRGQEDLTHDG